MSDEIKDQNGIIRPDDFWGRHHISTRLIILTFIVVYLGLTIASLYATIPVALIETAGWILFSSFIVLTLGINGVREVTDLIAKIKGK